MVTCIDFDGTCVTHAFPKVGESIGAEAVLKDLIDHGHRLILFTMRSDTKKGNYLTDALDWFKSKNIELYGVNKNPTQHTWTTSPKAAADLYIDDLSLSIPLTTPEGQKPHVDWQAARQLLIDKGVLKEVEDDEQKAMASVINNLASTRYAKKLGLWD